MSREVDQRVVEMQFNNAKFEKNVQQSINSLNALNESLQLEGAEKGIERVQAAAEHCDFDQMDTAVQTLSSHFSALEIIGITALQNITNKVINAGEALTKSLSVDQITSGWNKYAQKTASVQTIMNATGKSINKVNGYLDQLMWYSDETSYGFTDMTASLGQLTAAGGDIDKMIPMIMGIANATAYAGKGASEFSRVIYNLNQSYSQGYLSLMDWKSVELANVATAELKQQLIDTGVALGKLKEGEVTISTFSSSLSSKWADKDVMETAFGKLAEFTQAVKEGVDNKTYKNTSEAIEALADQYDEATVKAFKAAQEAKSFSDVVDATKDAVSSGWMETFDILFGNYTEAKEFWTGLADQFWDIFASGKDRRNSWLKSIFDSGMTQLMDDSDLSEQTALYQNTLEQIALANGSITQEAIDEAGSFDKALEQGIVSAEDLGAALGVSLAALQKAVSLSDEELAKQGLDRSKLERGVELYTEMYEAVQSGNLSLEEYSQKIGRMSGREHFFNGILNVLKAIQSILGPIGEAFGDVFMSSSDGMYGTLAKFDELTEKLILTEDTAEKVQKTFTGFFRVLHVALRGIVTAGKLGFTIIGKVINLIEPLISLLLSLGAGLGDILTYLDEGLGKAESVSDVILVLQNALNQLLAPLKEVWNGVRKFIRTGDLEAAKQEFKTFGAVADALSATLERLGPVGTALKTVFGGLAMVAGGALTTGFKWAETLMGKASSAFNQAGEDIELFQAEHVPTLESIRDAILGLPEKATAALEQFRSSGASAFSMIGDACSKALAPVKEFFNLQNGIDIYRLLALLDVGALAFMIGQLAKATKKFGDSFAALMKNPVTKFFDSLTDAVNAWKKQHTTNNLVSIAKGIATSIALIAGSVFLLSKIEDSGKAWEAMSQVMAAMIGMVVALRVLAKADMTGIDSLKIFTTMMGMSAGFLAMAGAVKVIAGVIQQLENIIPSRLNNIVENIRQIGTLLAVLVGMMAMFDAWNAHIKGVGSFLVVAAALAVVAKAATAMAQTDPEALDVAANALLKISGALSLCMVALAILNKGNSSLFGVIGKAISGFTNRISKAAKAALSMTAISTSLIILAGAFLVLNRVGVNNLKKLSAYLAGGLVSLAAAAAVMGKYGPQTTAAAASIALISAALMAFAAAMLLFETIDMDKMLGLLASVGAALAIIVSVTNLFPKTVGSLQGISAAALGLSLALLILVPVFKLFSGLSFEQVGAGILAITGLTAVLLVAAAAVGHFKVVAAGLVVLAKGFEVFCAGLSKLSGGVLKLSLAMAIIGLLAPFASTISKAIVEAGPDIQDALITVVTVICNTIIACVGPLSAALVALVQIVVIALVDTIKWAWDCGGEGGGIKGGLEYLYTEVVNFFDEHPLSDLLSDWVAKFFQAAQDFELNDIATWAAVTTEKIRGKSGKSRHEEIANSYGFRYEDSRTPGLTNMGDNPSTWELLGEMFGQGKDLGEDYAAGYAQGTASGTDAAADAGAQLADSAAEGTATAQDSSSPSKVAMELGGYFSEGYANGINSANSLAMVNAAVLELCSNADTTFRDFWGIHSPSTRAHEDGEYIATGLRNGLDDGWDPTVRYDLAIDVEPQFENDPADPIAEQIEEAQRSARAEAAARAEQFLIDDVGTFQDEATEAFGDVGATAASSMLDQFTRHWNEYLQPTLSSTLSSLNLPELGESWLPSQLRGNGNNGWLGLLLGTGDYSVDTGTTSGTSTGSSSGTKKTVAQQIEEKYKTQLEANKTLREIMDQEYELWLTENQYSASNDELLAKKAENAAAEIANQTDRVAIAQAKYDEMVSKWGKDKQETKEAYNDLLTEQTTLAQLKASQYTSLFEAVAARYDTDLDRLDKELSLWNAENEKTATQREKLAKQMASAYDELELKDKKLELAKEQYDTLAKEYGEDDDRTREAYNDWLDAQTEYVELQNDIAEAQLEMITAEIDMISTAQSQMQSRMDILSKVFDDGSLSEREDAYKSAVEEYGEDSDEAKTARFQGTTSAILSVVTALKNMNYQMQQTEQLEHELEMLTPGTDEYNSAYNDLLSSQSAFIGFAENLADAFNLEDSGKAMVLKLAHTVQKNWEPLTKSFAIVWNKATEQLPPQVTETLTAAFGEAFSDTGIEIGTEFVSAITSALSGDWGNAVVSAISGAIDFMGTDIGQQMAEKIAEMLMQSGAIDKGVSALTTFFKIGTKDAAALAEAAGVSGAAAAESMGALETAIAAIQGTGEAAVAAGEAGAGAVAAIGEGFAGLVAMLPEIWPILLAGAAILAILGGIAAYAIHRKKKNQTDGEEAGEDFDNDFADGIENGKDSISDAIGDMTDEATDIAAGAVSTISRVFDDDYKYTPQITPVLDLTDVDDGTSEMNDLFGAVKPVSLDGSASRKLAAEIDTVAELQNGVKNSENAQVLSAILGLGDRMDSVGESIRGMKVVVDGKTTLGWIDSGLGARAARRAR